MAYIFLIIGLCGLFMQFNSRFRSDQYYAGFTLAMVGGIVCVVLSYMDIVK